MHALTAVIYVHKRGGYLPKNSFRYRILIVDDDFITRQILQVLLEAQNYAVLFAEDGFEGLTALKHSLPDVILSDLEMPNMSGFEFLAVVRRRFPGIPVVVISGAFSGLSVPENLLADAFLSKEPFRPEEVIAVITRLIRELPTRLQASRPEKPAVW